MPRAKSTPAEAESQLPKFWLHSASGNLAIKRKGRVYYLGKDQKTAEAFYQQHSSRIESGLPVIATSDDRLNVHDIVNHFLIAQDQKVKRGDLSPRTYADYKKTAVRMKSLLGENSIVEELRANDFNKYLDVYGSGKSPVSVGNEVVRVKTILKWAYESELLNRPVRYGPDFKQPSKRRLKIYRNNQGKSLFTAANVNAILDESSVHLKAMVYLGINCGYKNSDVAELKLQAFDPKIPWIDFPRPKTGEDRRCPLWPETIDALSASLNRRPKPTTKRAQDKLFLYRDGDVWCDNIGDGQTDHLSKAIKRILKSLEIFRVGMGFSWLRHTHRTWADEAKDQPAANFIMGHADPSMAAVYRQEISDARLIAVSDMVRSFLRGERKL